MTFIKRNIDVTFTLAQGSFSGSGLNTLTLQGLRVSSKLVKAGGVSMGTAQIAVYGMELRHMNQLSTLGMQIQLIPRNFITLTAGDDERGMFKVFQGTITNAYTDFQSAPQVAFRINAHTGLSEAVQSIPATSYRGSVDVATVMEQLARQMNLTFENNGVHVQLSNPYFPGSARTQAQEAAQAANVSWTIDDGVLAIWLKNGARGAPSVDVNASTGMIGYPAYTAQGILLMTEWNPAIRFGATVNVKSDLQPACGKWALYQLEHDLEAQAPAGRWQSTLGCYNPAYPPPVTA